jgi:hypothetical protein
MMFSAGIAFILGDMAMSDPLDESYLVIAI